MGRKKSTKMAAVVVPAGMIIPADMIRLEFTPKSITYKPLPGPALLMEVYVEGEVSFHTITEGEVGRMCVKADSGGLHYTPYGENKTLPPMHEHTCNRLSDMLHCYLSALSRKKSYFWMSRKENK